MGPRVAWPVGGTLVEDIVRLPLLLGLVQFLISGTLYSTIGAINLVACNLFQIVPIIFKGFFISDEWNIVWLRFIRFLYSTFFVLDVFKFDRLLL